MLAVTVRSRWPTNSAIRAHGTHADAAARSDGGGDRAATRTCRDCSEGFGQPTQLTGVCNQAGHRLQPVLKRVAGSPKDVPRVVFVDPVGAVTLVLGADTFVPCVAVPA